MHIFHILWKITLLSKTNRLIENSGILHNTTYPHLEFRNV